MIDPSPLVTLMPVLAVIVALASEPSVVLPIRSCPSVKVVWPVPPAATGRVPAVSVVVPDEKIARLVAPKVVRPVPPSVVATGVVRLKVVPVRVSPVPAE